MHGTRALTRTPRRSLVAVLVALAATLSLVGAPTAPANELGDRSKRVHREIDQARKELRHSSRALVRATAKVARAQEKLEAAESALDERQAEAAAAAVVDAQMQSELDVANARLGRARSALARGRRSHEAQEQVLRHIAAQTYQAGAPSLMGLTLVLTSRDPQELTTQLNVVQNLLDKEAATLRRLEASRLLLELQKERVAEAVKEVAVRRQAAAETLAARRAAEARAQQAADRVAEALDERTRARQQALRTKRADQRRLQQLREERDKISRLIRKREADLRRKRSKRAIERAKKASLSRRAPMMMPIDSYITSPFGMRLHPIYRAWRLHDGTDFGARCGRPIRAAASGRVIGRYYNVGYGNRVIIAHGYMRGVSVTTTYNHLSRYSAYVGQRVRKGDVIGYVGSTGYSTGCHLHFMVFRTGYPVNPMFWLR
ncbi:peptidoglycan DD-metalloendopeptidase family protein [Nocardioides pakistanensis]